VAARLLSAFFKSAWSQIIVPAVWVIRDGGHKQSTGFGAGDIAKAEGALEGYLTDKYRAPRTGKRDPADVQVADVVAGRACVDDQPVVSRPPAPVKGWSSVYKGR
jgi:hypothetical protein